MTIVNCFTNVDTVLIKLKDSSQCIVYSNTSSTPVTPSLSYADKEAAKDCLTSMVGSVSTCAGVTICPINFQCSITDDCGKRANACHPLDRTAYKLPEPYASQLESCWGKCGTLLFDASYSIYCCKYSSYPDHRIIVHSFNKFLMNSTSYNGDCFDKFTSCSMLSYSGLKSPSYAACLGSCNVSTTSSISKIYQRMFWTFGRR